MSSQITELQAKEAIYKIVRYTGLLPNFVVQENKEVKTAVAFIKNKQRYIEFNSEIISQIVDSTNTDWAAISILAHEIAHHLLGHTLEVKKINPGDELACDKFSGFVLYQMGATIDQALSAMEIAGRKNGDHIHAAKQARLEAILNGWEEALFLDDNTMLEASSLLTQVNFKYKLHFEGDENSYYITQDDEVVWYDNFAKPISFGEFSISQRKNYSNEIKWSELHFFIDSNQTVWQKTDYEVMMIVGKLMPY